MSSFYYNRGFNEEPALAVRCDGCGDVLYTDVVGQAFPDHIRINAKEAGWVNRKMNGKWVQLCPTCKAYVLEQTRKKRLGGI